MKVFKKNDNSFICENCGAKVDKLGYSSRDHCPVCLTSLHVDINPGDRQNSCKGLMVPVEINFSSKGYVIKFQCEKCGEFHNNKTAQDDNFETILMVMNKTYKKDFFKK